MSKEVNDFLQTQGKILHFCNAFFKLIYCILFSSGVKPYNFKMNCDSGRPFLFHSLVTIKNIDLWFQYWTLIFPSLRKHPSLFAPRREGRFAGNSEERRLISQAKFFFFCCQRAMASGWTSKPSSPRKHNRHQHPRVFHQHHVPPLARQVNYRRSYRFTIEP